MSNIKIFAKTIEETARQQIEQFASLEAFKNSKIRVMPDVHSGAGCVIGFTADLGDKVIPNVVGVDIGCGMFAVNMGRLVDINLQAVDSFIRANIPSGMNVNNAPLITLEESRIEELKCCGSLRNVERLVNSVGSLGGGNHFIEIDVDESTGENWLIIHSGSRNLGKQVAEIYQDIAIKKCNSQKEEIAKVVSEYKAQGREKEIATAIAALKAQKPKIPNDLCYLEGEDRENYLHDMRICQLFAEVNRRFIANAILFFLFNNDFDTIEEMDCFTTMHNYIDDNNIVRKGAISAQEGEKLLIPINMRDGCILGVGKGNEDWNCSAPHGAGRLMSRSKAKETLTMEEYQNTMNGIYTTSVCNETLDEAPQAYKPLEEITELIKPTVDIISILKPIYNFKAKD
jgi:RNA-splicing ligase RtcB